MGGTTFLLLIKNQVNVIKSFAVLHFVQTGALALRPLATVADTSIT
jgi:hypothetical protein